MNEAILISGLYPYARNGKKFYPQKTIYEIEQSVLVNPCYKEKLVCYAADKEMASILLKQGLYVHKICTDAPNEIQINAAHKMKHWFMFHAVKEFKKVLWIDWDTYLIKSLNEQFWKFCFQTATPKFTYISQYWAVVNCAVYYLCDDAIPIMEKSFYSKVSEPNDELLWASVLPKNILQLREYWLEDKVINICKEDEIKNITANTYFAHVNQFGYVSSILEQVKKL